MCLLPPSTTRDPPPLFLRSSVPRFLVCTFLSLFFLKSVVGRNVSDYFWGRAARVHLTRWGHGSALASQWRPILALYSPTFTLGMARLCASLAHSPRLFTHEFNVPSALAVVPGLGLVVREANNSGRLQVFATPDAMAAMSCTRVAWMVGVARAVLRRSEV